VSRKAIRMIPNFIDTAAFPVTTSDALNAARKVWGLSEQSFVIGSVGDIGPRKRQIDLVQALARVARGRSGLQAGARRPASRRLLQ
jgi:hypothetical protein